MLTITIDTEDEATFRDLFDKSVDSFVEKIYAEVGKSPDLDNKEKAYRVAAETLAHYLM